MILKRYTEENNSQEFDAIIIGGGITGAAVAYIAASRGLRIALFEKKDYGGATSAATSKLIHGGLRYLANLEFRMVRESLQERRILGNIAPNFTYPVPFLLPSYKKWKGNIWKLMAGMYLYDMLSFDKKKTWDKTKRLPNHKYISYRNTIEKEPNLIKDNLRNSIIFYDYQNIFPERLTLAFIKSAVEYGAKVSNYSQVEDFIFSNKNTVSGIIVKDVLTDEIKKYNSSLIINCGGTWADIILQKALGNKQTSHKVKRSEGIHIITPKIAGDHVVSLQKKDSKHLMIMPWRGHSLIGTTDKEYKGNPDDYAVSAESIKELIDGVNENFGKKISFSDIKHAYGGLRPLIDDQTEVSYNTSRKYEVYDTANDGIDGLITVEGGKYTTSRNLAANVLKMIEKKTDRKLRNSVSSKQYLYGCDIKNMTEFLLKQHWQYDNEFGAKTVEYLSHNYGKESRILMDYVIADKKELKKQINDDGEILGQVIYAIKYESAKNLKDIMLRRTGIGTLGKPDDVIIQEIIKTASEILNWNTKQEQEEYDSLMKIYNIPKPK